MAASETAGGTSSGPPVSDAELRAMADKYQIRELIDEYSNIVTQKAFDRLGDLFIEDCVWRTEGTRPRNFRGRPAVVEAITAAVVNYPMIFQMPHAPRIRLDGDRASSSLLLHEIGKVEDGAMPWVLAIYEDSFVRTAQGWRFSERLFQALHYDPGK